MWWETSASRMKVGEIEHLAHGLRELMDEGHCSERVAEIVAGDIVVAATQLVELLRETAHG